MMNKRIAEQHGGLNYTELNWQAYLNFSSRAQQNKIKKLLKQNKAKRNTSDKV